jgi:hypothetical protein
MGMRNLLLWISCVTLSVACNSEVKSIDNNSDDPSVAANSDGGNVDTTSQKSSNDSRQSLLDDGNEMDKKVREGFERTAKAFMESYRDGKFSEFVQYMHPAVVKAYGGPFAFIDRLQKSKAKDPQQYRKWESGPLEAYTSVKDSKGRITGYYCVVPIKRWLVGTPDTEFQLQWLGGQSLDGKNFHFIDITDGDKGMIYRIMPDMRFLLENLEEEVPAS